MARHGGLHMAWLMRLLGGAALRRLGSGAILSIVLGGAVWFYGQWRAGKLEGVINTQQATLTATIQSRDEWRAAAEASAARLQRMEAIEAAARESVSRLQAELAAQDAAGAVQEQRIEAAPESDDGPVAPVLRDTLSELRQMSDSP
ncbi:MAG: hypothetical protein RQ757_07050 [Pseudomonadales bacterium]|nr:hypothetical protein [Pseudomonadales bacterium]